jgi:arylsulfatase
MGNANKPNVVLIFIDDLGVGDIGSFGATEYRTPNLDRMASEGMRFTNFNVPQAVCSASRAALLTGCYPNRIGMKGALSPRAMLGLNPDEETIAELLKEQGYGTAIVGKWHLGHHKKFMPLQHGFDEYLGIPYSNDMTPFFYNESRNTVMPEQFKHKMSYPELPLVKGNNKIRELTTVSDQKGLTTLYTETAVDYINSRKEIPFFLYLAHSMPHVPLAVSEKFAGKSEQGLYGDVVMEIDWSVGQILEALDKNGLTENTLVIFTSDNGPWLNFGEHAGSTGGLREGKGTSFEGGNRVPAIMKWPRTIPEGRINNKLSTTMDILPTIVAITGANLPVERIDGINILPLLQGEERANPRRSMYYYYNENDLEAVRRDNWKLVFPHGHRSYEGVLPGKNGLPGAYNQKETTLSLFNLRRDPGERYNVKELYPEILLELQELAERAREDLGDDLNNRKGKNRRKHGEL